MDSGFGVDRMLKYFAKSQTLELKNASPPNFNGFWRNQHASEMELVVNAGGAVIGKYRTGVGAPEPTHDFDLVGFVSTDQLSFTVNFGRYGSLTSWVGQHTCENGVEQIKTMWLLSRNVEDADEGEALWGAVLTGADVFHR